MWHHASGYTLSLVGVCILFVQTHREGVKYLEEDALMSGVGMWFCLLIGTSTN